MPKYLVNPGQFKEFIANGKCEVKTASKLLVGYPEPRFLEATDEDGTTVVEYSGYDPFAYDWVDGVSLESYQY